MNELSAEFLNYSEPRFITKEEFGKLPKDSNFNFGFTNNDQSWSAHLIIKDKNVQISTEFDDDIHQQLDNKTLSLFRVEENGKKLIYPPNSTETSETETLEGNNEGYYIDGLEPRKLIIDKSKPERVKPVEVAELINQVPGKELIFYTGAGISMGGERPVWGMDQLKNELGLNDMGENYLNHFINPEKNNPQSILDKVQQLKNQLFEDVSTPAHIAIADIVRKKEGAIVLTENIDYKHEAEGSRLKVIHMDADQTAFNKIKLRINTKFVVTVGLSKDDRAVINYLKNKNPSLRIIAFTLNDDTLPEYLDGNDMVVLGDVQQTLPLVARTCFYKSHE